MIKASKGDSADTSTVAGVVSSSNIGLFEGREGAEEEESGVAVGRAACILKTELQRGMLQQTLSKLGQSSKLEATTRRIAIIQTCIIIKITIKHIK